MKKVLIVSHHFLPVHNVGVKQFWGYCKYLPDFGWQPIVLTHEWKEPIPMDQAWWGLSFEGEILREAEKKIKIVRTQTDLRPTMFMKGHAALARHTRSSVPGVKRWGLTPLRKLLSSLYPLLGPFPDACGLWVKDAVRLGIQICRTEGIEALISNCPPETNHRVAFHVARRTGIPWVPYFGDLYGFFIDEQDLHGSWWKRRLAYAIRRRWMRHSGRAMCVSPYMMEYLRRYYHVEGDVVVVGFDEDDFRNRTAGGNSERFVVSHTGSVYPVNQKPEMLFEAVARLAEKHPNHLADWTIRFVGSKCEDDLRRMVDGIRGRTVYSFLPKVSPAEAIRIQQESHVLLLFNTTHARGKHGTMSYPSKIFEYLAAGKPILAIPSDRDWVEEILTTTGAGVGASTVEDVEARLTAWYLDWRKGGRVPYGGKKAEILKFSHQEQSRRIAAALDRLSLKS